MQNLTIRLLLAFSTIALTSNAQLTHLEKLNDIMETVYSGRIEQNGKISYSSGQSIFSSTDEGLTWEETVTPLDFTSGHTRFKGLKNGNYILVTGNKMHYKSNGEWKLLQIDGDSLFNAAPVVIDDKVILFKENTMYAYDDNTNEVNKIKAFDPLSFYWTQVFQNHFILVFGEERQIWTKELEYVSTINFPESVFITKEGLIIKTRITNPEPGKYGNTLEISEDNGVSFSLFHESNDKELRLIGEIDGRLYFKGFRTLYNAWMPGKFTSRLGYFDLQTYEISEVSDGGGSIIANNTLYHSIGTTYFKYPEGNLSNRVMLSNLRTDATPIEKLRRTSDGVIYALTRDFLYKSYDEGKTWENLLGFQSVEDIDLDDDNNLYCLSDSRILKSNDEGTVFTELSQQFSGGNIDFPNEIICLGSNKLIVKGIGKYSPGGANVAGCFDCFNHFPQYIFMSEDDGTNWETKYVFEIDFPLISAEDIHGYPSTQAFQSSYFVKTPEDVIFTNREFHSFSSDYNYGIAKIDRSNLSVNTTQQPTDQRNDIRYGLTQSGDLIKNDLGNISSSKDFGVSFTELGTTDLGDIYPGAAKESIYVISDNDNNEGTVFYQADYQAPFVELDFKLQSTNEAIPNLFDWTYTDGKSDFLFSGSNTYKVIDILSEAEEANITNQNIQIDIYPNPFSKILNVNIKKHWSSFTSLEIYDSKGSLMKTSQVLEPQVAVNLENYASGIYYLRIVGKNNIYNQKIFKL